MLMPSNTEQTPPQLDLRSRAPSPEVYDLTKDELPDLGNYQECSMCYEETTETLPCQHPVCVWCKQNLRDTCYPMCHADILHRSCSGNTTPWTTPGLVAVPRMWCVYEGHLHMPNVPPGTLSCLKRLHTAPGRLAA